MITECVSGDLQHIILGHFLPYTSNRLVKEQFFKNSLVLHLCTKYHDYWMFCWSAIFCETNISHFGSFLVYVLTFLRAKRVKKLIFLRDNNFYREFTLT